jgi:hypothetical protein
MFSWLYDLIIKAFKVAPDVKVIQTPLSIFH